ncbi:MAG: aromatic ring-hydroxylating dioxygenase subunit alpha [Rhodoferax sp.]|nr:aromatic ring-hydroxylating dioxygenase subunit alpha [Rhodoferax sp.]MBP9928005.1 aromatic ring-hydroxylating dioxygenase subunit alpha [Rhodoferax sp.]HQX59793.1 aromatic ring-hydroxylating dioxygenase subunit alpha [Burkholderiaceae bacterium]HQZ04720.1 aromatic ring-hydroxylating dioxygenase subunit alpha [Burkholderiaceae bacterium]
MPFDTLDPNVRSDWLTIGSASLLDGCTADRPMATRLLGNHLQAWRDAAALPVVIADGQSLPVLERYGYLWVHTGDGPQRTLFELPEYDESGRRIVDCGGIGVATSGLRVVENFLDMGHFPYIHTGTLGKVPQTEVAPYRVHVDAATQEIWALDCHFFQPRASACAADGIDAQYRYRVMQPFTAALYKSSPDHAGALDVIGLFVQPLDDEHVIAHVLLVYFEDRLGDADMIAFQQMIFGQDKPILENQRPRRLPLHGPLEAHMRCDLTSATYRRWLRQRGMAFGVHPD